MIRKNQEQEGEREQANPLLSAMKEQNERLARRCQSLLSAQEKLQKAFQHEKDSNAAKRRFITRMSHDIRTPLSAIIGYTALASTHAEQPDRVREYLYKLDTASGHLLSLLNEILDVSKVESGRFSLTETPTHLDALLEELTDILDGNMRAKKLDCVFEKDYQHEYVACDPFRLRQMLLNCLSNAMKFTRASGHVHFTVSEKPEKDGKGGIYTFVIEDDGIGMSKDFVAHIFDPFAPKQKGSTGLGMVIVKNLVDMMSGSIHIESELGEGTRIEITLPLAYRKEEAEIEPDEKEEDGATLSGHILLAEDNGINVEIVLALLEDTKVLVDVAQNGEEAVKHVAEAGENAYDLVLMDIQMPVMGGLEATEKIRALPLAYVSDLPIVAMSANAYEEDRRSAMAIGMNDYLTKPIDLKELFEKLHKYLDKDGYKNIR